MAQVFDCKNPRCRQPIPLLYPIVQAPGDQSAALAGGFHVAIGCPACGHVHEYLPRDAHRGDVANATPLAFYDLEFRCGHKNCGVLVHFYAVEASGTAPQVVLAKVAAGFFHATCERGHSFFPAGGDYQIHELKPATR